MRSTYRRVYTSMPTVCLAHDLGLLYECIQYKKLFCETYSIKRGSLLNEALSKDRCIASYIYFNRKYRYILYSVEGVFLVETDT